MNSRLFESGEFGAVVLTSESNRRYFTGIETSFGCVVLTAKASHFITDSRYRLAAEEALPQWKLHFVSGGGLYSEIGEIIRDASLESAGLEYDVLSYNEFQLLKDSLPDRVRVLPCDHVMTELRAIKSADEIARIAEAQSITETALQKVFSMMKPRMSERDLYAEFTYQALKLGADGMAFDPIVAGGAGSAEPHHKITDRAIGHGVPVLFDVGVKVGGYCSDLSRTVTLGSADPQMQKVHELVLHAQQYALSKIKAGITCHEADSYAREFLTANGYEFGHSVGHGVGLDIHEYPRVARNNDVVLKPDMVITVEPGVYIPGVGGVRIEDTVVVTENGIRNLTSLHKKFEI